jgi:hypothetical protein
MAEWAGGANVSSIKNIVLGWGLVSVVPDFGKYVQDYWMADVEKLMAGEVECEGVAQESILNEFLSTERIRNMPVLITKLQNYIFLCKEGFWQITNILTECEGALGAPTLEMGGNYREILTCEGKYYGGKIGTLHGWYKDVE